MYLVFSKSMISIRGWLFVRYLDWRDNHDEELFNDDTEKAPNEGFEWVDDENDWSYEDELCERKIENHAQ